MKNFRPALETFEGIEILFAPHLQFWLDLGLQIPGPTSEFKFLTKVEDTRVRVDESTPETRGPMVREAEMEIENLARHLGQYAGDAADSCEKLSQHGEDAPSLFENT